MTFIFDWAIKFLTQTNFRVILSTRYGNVWDLDILGGGNTSTVSK